MQYTLDGNSVHGCPKLLLAKWLGLGFSSAVRVRARDRSGLVSFFFGLLTVLNMMNIFVLLSWPEAWV